MDSSKHREVNRCMLNRNSSAAPEEEERPTGEDIAQVIESLDWIEFSLWRFVFRLKNEIEEDNRHIERAGEWKRR